MKAFVRDRYGSPDVLRLEELPMPDVPDEAVLVRVRASSVNAYDWHVLRGKPYLARLSEGLRAPKERRLGLDVAGEVEAVGSGVTDLAVGDRVFGSRIGAFGEYVASRNMVRMPAGLTVEQAAAVPVAGLTALQGLRDKAGLQADERVLVIGAGGGVGTMAVQVAKAMGAEVTAVTNPDGLEVVLAIGADAVVDYTREDVARRRERYDVIFDIGGRQRLSALRGLLTSRGRVVLVAPQPGQWIGPVARVVGAAMTSRFSSRKVLPFLSATRTGDMEHLRDLTEAGKLTPVVDRTYPFEQTPDAIRRMEAGRARGKIVITVP
jgi:NADPH:quinone reductase-like Zn-dependent oxidoreductase